MKITGHLLRAFIGPLIFLIHCESLKITGHLLRAFIGPLIFLIPLRITENHRTFTSSLHFFLFSLSDIMDLRHQSSAMCIIMLEGEDTHPWSATKVGNHIAATIPVDQ